MYRNRLKQLEDSQTALNNVYGSTKASKFLQDLAAEQDSIDFVVIGDSNTGSAVAGMWGYHNGLQQALNDKGYTCYGTSVFPVLHEGTLATTASGWKTAGTIPLKTAVLLSGNDATAQSEAPSYYSQFSPAGYIDMTAVNPVYVRYGSSGTGSGGPNIESWAYLARNSASYFNSFGMQIDPDHPLSANGNTLYYRLKYGKLLNANNTTVSPAQDGGFCPIVFKIAGSAVGGGTEITARKFVSCAAANAGEVGQVFVEDLAFTTASSTGYRAGWGFVGSGTQKTCGPMILHCQSMYARRKGWAVTSLSYLGGYNSQGIAGVLGGVKNTSLKALVKEIRERQITAGGSGRVVIMAQSGVNSYPASPGPNYETPQRWTDAYKSIWESFKEIWISLGYPLSDLAIVSWVSHPISSSDGSSGSSLANNLISVRSAANQMAIENPDMTVIDIKKLINYNRLITGNGNGQSLFQYWNNSPIVAPDFPAHLAGGGVLTGASVFATNATFDATSFTLTGAYATEGTTTNYFSNRLLEIVEVGYIPANSPTSVVASTGGNFTCASFSGLVANRPIVVSGTLTGTATITGYSNPTTYYIIGTPTSTSFQLSASYGGAAITTTAGSTTGLTFTYGIQNRQPQFAFITEYNGTTKVAKVRAWPNGTPSNSGGGITPLDVGAAGNKNVTYKLITIHPADGYTQYMNNVLSSLTTTNL